MGLNIYVRWGTQFDEDGDCLDFPSEIRNRQYKINASEVGNMDHNWSSVSFCYGAAEMLKAPNPIGGLWPEWNGHNCEVLDVTPEQLERLLKFRQDARLWLHEASKRQLPEWMSEGDWKYFCNRLRESTVLIDFLDQHKDKPGLRIEFS